MKTIKTILRLSCLILSLLICTSSAEEENTEYKIKAGYLYNFIKFVTWPTTNAKTFNVCIVGQDPFGALIDPIEQRTAFGLPIKLYRFNAESKTQSCQIVYISTSHKTVFGTNDKLTVNNADNVLSVGEGENFVEQGGMIGFVNRDGKIKLQINMNVLQESNLTVSAKLLEVAEIVGDGNHE